MISDSPSWRFARMAPSQINQDPVQGEFFTAAADLPDRLVREAVQNSLDARWRGETVRVRFAFSDPDEPLPRSRAARYLRGLKPHLEAVAGAQNALENSELAAMLRDAEGPAHVTWNPHAERLKKRWTGGHSRVQRVRRAAVVLLDSLLERPDERQYDALADLFPGRVAGPRRSRRRQRRKGAAPPGSRPLFEVRRANRGFVVRGRPNSPVDVGSSWEVRFAHDVPRGGSKRAFRQYDRGLRDGCPDFSLGDGPVVVESEGCGAQIVGANALMLRVDTEDFRLAVVGLPERDVIVDVRSAESGPPEEGAE